MKKKNIINLIKYHMDNNEMNFREEAMKIADSFDSMGDYELSSYVRALLSNTDTFVPQTNELDNSFFSKVVLNQDPLPLPNVISEDIIGVINAVNHNVGVSKFLFEGAPGTGKTETVKHIARILERDLYIVNFSYLVDSRLGQTAKNIVDIFNEINNISNPNQVIILFDEIDVIALDRINQNDLREMGRVTSTILKELDNLKDDILLIATTNLFNKVDKALIRRFDAVINFNRYSNDDLIDVAESILNVYLKQFPDVTKDLRLFKKIIKSFENVYYPGDLKNLIKSSLAFSDPGDPNDYFKKFYLRGHGLDEMNIKTLNKQGFTIREIETLTDISKSSVSRELRGVLNE